MGKVFNSERISRGGRRWRRLRYRQGADGATFPGRKRSPKICRISTREMESCCCSPTGNDHGRRSRGWRT